MCNFNRYIFTNLIDMDLSLITDDGFVYPFSLLVYSFTSIQEGSPTF